MTDNSHGHHVGSIVNYRCPMYIATISSGMTTKPSRSSLPPMPRHFLIIVIVVLSLVRVDCMGQSVALLADSSFLHIPGADYSAGALHRLVFGSVWRDVWPTPIRIPVLDLQRSAGGLTPVQRGGGFQTASLRFRGADGFFYKFRSLDKDPTAVLPVELRETFVADIAQDMIATAHPFAPLVAAPLLNAVGILQAEPMLVIMPDDPLLGVYRKEFGGRAGMIEVHPDENETDKGAFGGARKISGTPALFDKLDSDNDERVHTAAYLKARLLDIFLGDWDRHTDQWRWARLDEDGTHFWHPIPRDRDQAFCRFDGLVPWLATVFIPQTESCDPEYPGMQYLSWSGRHLDRRFLAEADWPLYDSLLAVILPVLNDTVLRRATDALPQELRDRFGPSTFALLQARRDGLPVAAREYYRVLGSEVDIRLSNKDDLVLITRLPDESLDVDIRKRKKSGESLFYRRFDGDVTREVRVFCGGGDDSVFVRGEAESSINLIVLGGAGRDSFTDSSRVADGRCPLLTTFPGPGAGTTFNDGGKGSTIIGGAITRRERRAPPLDTLEYHFEQKNRDWGGMWFPAVHGMWNSDLGILFGGGATYTRYGFARTPHAARIHMIAGVAPVTSNFDARVSMDFRLPYSSTAVQFDALYTTFEVLNYFGMGNETTMSKERGYHYAVKQKELRVQPSISLMPHRHVTVSIGGSMRYIGHDLDDALLYLLVEKPYGYQTMLFMQGDLSITGDWRDDPVWPRSGVLVTTEINTVPASFDAREPWTTFSADARLYLTANTLSEATLALRMAGRHTEGSIPFFASSFLGGLESLRGFEKNRFAGASSLLAAAELRIGLMDMFLILPTRLGILAFAETGRVYQFGETSSLWHPSFGAGLWLAPVSTDFTISASVAASSERMRFDIIGGFAF